MKKKNLKNSVENAIEAVNGLKASTEISQDKVQDTLAIKALEASIRKIERFEKEIAALKDKLKGKKNELNQERTLIQELAKTTKKRLKNKPPKKEKSVKPNKSQKVEKVETQEETT